MYPSLGGVISPVWAPLWSGLGTGMNSPGRGELPILVVSPGGVGVRVGVRVWYLALGFTAQPIVSRVRRGALVWGQVRAFLSPSLFGVAPCWG